MCLSLVSICQNWHNSSLAHTLFASLSDHHLDRSYSHTQISGLHFCTFIISDHSHTPDLVNGFVTYYTATSESLWTAFLSIKLSYSDHSHIAPYLVNYYANYCTASSESLWTAFLHFYHCQTTLTHQISKLLCSTYCIASSESLWTAFLHFLHLQTTLTHQI